MSNNNYQDASHKLFKSYERATPHLSGLDSHTRDLTGMMRLLRMANIKTDFAPTVTVTGSKGKGSTAIMTAVLLQQAGYRVGLLTSPSFLSLRERIRVDFQAIPDADFIRIVNDLAPTISKVDMTLAPDKYLSPTGLFLANALIYFQEQGVTAMVLEVGRGGRFDDVRLVENQVACITTIMDEHLDKFGADKLAVAWHKSGIIKEHSQVVSAHQTPEVADYLRQYCDQMEANWFMLDQDFTYQQTFQDLKQIVDVQFPALNEANRFELPTPAKYQAMNMALAFANANLLDRTVNAKLAETPSIVPRVRLAGRCEILQESNPKVIVDGAINRQTAQQFRESVQNGSQGKITLVTALPDDKDYQGLLEELMPYVERVIVTHVTAAHLHFSDDVQNFASRYKQNVVFEKDVFTAFKIAEQDTDTLWVVGTQSLVRDALDYWGASLETLLIND